VERMTPDEFEMGKEWLNETFHLIRFVNLIEFLSFTLSLESRCSAIGAFLTMFCLQA
jgi:hypothetical protein